MVVASPYQSIITSNINEFNNPTKRDKGTDGFFKNKVQRDVVGREVGGGFMFGNACKN